MNKIEQIREMDRTLMNEFSTRCVGRLGSYLPLKIFLSVFQRFLDANFLKEVEKDGLVIDSAASLFEKGKGMKDLDVKAIFEMGKKVDEDFVRKVSVPPLSINMQYDMIAEIRKKRILSLGNLTFDLLAHWREGISISEIIRGTYREEEFRAVLGEILRLYNLETKMLSSSIRLHKPADKVKDLFAEKLLTTMEEVARDIARERTRMIYAGENVCVNPT